MWTWPAQHNPLPDIIRTSTTAAVLVRTDAQARKLWSPLVTYIISRLGCIGEESVRPTTWDDASPRHLA